MMLALKERMGQVAKRKMVLTWTWHPRPLNTAVANSALLAGTKFGMDVTLLCPEPDYLLDSQFMDAAKSNAVTSGGSLQVSHDIESAYDGADFVYAKSWGALPYYGRPEEEWELRRNYRDFIVNEEKMALTNNGLVSHCLPLRRNIKATDAVISSTSICLSTSARRLTYRHDLPFLYLPSFSINLAWGLKPEIT